MWTAPAPLAATATGRAGWCEPTAQVSFFCVLWAPLPRSLRFLSLRLALPMAAPGPGATCSGSLSPRAGVALSDDELSTASKPAAWLRRLPVTPRLRLGAVLL